LKCCLSCNMQQAVLLCVGNPGALAS
jgi:hypothetical protein